ncbi:hypothetical protein [Streptomyces triculaminicus]|uniref:hypothetical protein n=1 Tax=Streptomyces triculaminicus TaxID=2816232 RepID=UPI003799E61B
MGKHKDGSKKQKNVSNTVKDTDANVVVQAGRITGPMNLGSGDQYNAPVFSGNGAKVINGDNNAPIVQNFSR